MQNTTEVKPSGKKDHFNLSINGVVLGEWEISDLRHHIEIIDTTIHH
jgi:hypothetical protein|tara:strand:- start:209 stop:349 length:141 start_codon:yes stop_codon:yes gene_type:complete